MPTPRTFLYTSGFRISAPSPAKATATSVPPFTAPLSAMCSGTLARVGSLGPVLVVISSFAIRRLLAAMLARDLDAHAAGGALDHLHRAFDARRIEVVHLRLGDLLHRRATDLADLLFVRLARALLDARLFADEVRGGRRLRDEGVRAILEDRHHRGHDGAGERRGALVVLLDELTHVDAVRAERGTDRRRGG